MRLAVDRNLVPERAAGRDVLVDGRDAAHPRVDRGHEQQLHRAPPPEAAAAVRRQTPPGPSARSRPVPLSNDVRGSQPRTDLRQADVGPHRALLSRPGRRAHDLVPPGGWPNAAMTDCGELVDRERAPAAEIDDAAARRGRVERAHPSLDDVVDVDEVARLLAVAEDGDRLAAQQVAREDPEHALIRIAEGLARAVDAEHAQRGDAEVETEVGPLRGRMHVALGGELGDAVVGIRLARLALGRRHGPAVAVERHRAGIDQPRHLVLQAQLQNVQRAFDVGAQVRDRIGEGADDRDLTGDVADRIQSARRRPARPPPAG